MSCYRFILIALLLTVSSVHGQKIQQSQTGFGNGVDIGFTLFTTKEESTSSPIVGSPFLNEAFTPGVMHVQGQKPLELLLRYDVKNELVQLKVNETDEKIYTLPNKIDVEYTFNNQSLQYRNVTSGSNIINGYFIVHYNGDNYQLLEKPIIEIFQPVKAKTAYHRDKSAKMSIKSNFYVVRPNAKTLKIKINHREAKKLIQTKEAKEFLRANKIRSVHDFVKFLFHMDQLSRK